MLDGERGEGVRFAMEVVTRVGDIYGAEKLVQISSSHVLGHYSSLHDAGVEMMERFTGSKASFRVPTTVDPISIEPERWRDLKIQSSYAEKQMRLTNALMGLGVIPSFTCTPYECCNVPRHGEILAWSESSAVAYVNSIVGAKTNRLTAGLDVSCAITGLTPYFGLLIPENRFGQVLIEVKKRKLGNLDFHTIGYIIGKTVGNRIPVVTGLPLDAKNYQLKGLASAAASSGSVALFHAVGISPDARNVDQAFGPNELEDKIVIDESGIREAEDEITTSRENPDFVAIGCPHYSIPELIELTHMVKGKRVKRNVEFWVYTSKHVAAYIREMGVLQTIEASGIRVLTSTCAVISPIKEWGFKVMMTNSAKFANVIPSEHKIDVYYAPLKDLIEYATKGE